MSEFKVSLRETTDIKIIDLSGFLDLHTAPILEETIANLIENKQFKMIVNFQDLNYISSAGLGVFMAFIEKIRQNDGDIKLTSMKDKIYNIFDMIGFPLLFEIYKTDDEALTKFQK